MVISQTARERWDGWNTYYQVVTELSPEEWVYGNLESYVVTHRDCLSAERIRFTGKEPCSLVRELKEKPAKKKSSRNL